MKGLKTHLCYVGFNPKQNIHKCQAVAKMFSVHTASEKFENATIDQPSLSTCRLFNVKRSMIWAMKNKYQRGSRYNSNCTVLVTKVVYSVVAKDE